MSQAPGFIYEEDVSLIEYIRSNSVLYDTAHERHKDNAFKELIWREIAIQMGKSANQCKRRWKNIKSSYLKSQHTESEPTNKSNNFRLLSYRLSFLDVNQIRLNTTSNTANSENNGKLGEALNYESLNDDNLSKSSSNNPPNDEECRNPPKEDKIAMILAKGLKEINEMILNCFLKQIEIFNNTSFTVKIQNEKNNISNAQNNGTAGDEHVEDTNDKSEQENKLTPTQLKLDNIFFYFTEKLAQSKDKHTILQSLQKEIELLYNKSETTESLGLFFRSVLKDIEYVCPRAINDLKPRIIKCVSDVREMYAYSDVSLGSSSRNLSEKFAKSEEENKHSFNFIKKVHMLYHTFETKNAMELFFLSVIADIEDFSVRAIDDVKLRILESVSEVKHIYCNQDVSSAISSNSDVIPNYLQSLNFPQNNLNTQGPPSQGYNIVYYNVPVYYSQPPYYIQH